MLSQVFLVGLDQFSSIVEVFDIVPSIPFRVVAGPAYEVFNGQSSTSPDCPLIEKAVNLEGLMSISVTFHKDQGGVLRTGALERVFGWVWSWFELSHRENWVDLPVTRYIKLISQSTYFLDDLEGADVLLGQFLSHPDGGKDRVAFMKFEYSPISNSHKQELVASVVELLLICERKRYCVIGLSTGDVSVGRGQGRTKVQGPLGREVVGDFVRRFPSSQRGGVIQQ